MKTKSIITILIVLLFTGSLYAQPANDDCSGAINITDLAGGCVTYDNTGATADLANGSCVGGTNNIWFSFTAQGPSVDINIINAANKFKPELTLLYFDPTPCDFASALEVACQSGGGQWTDVTLSSSGTLTPGQVYYIIMTTDGDGTAGTFDLCVTNPITPANDLVCDAIVLPVDGSCLNNQDNSGSTVDWYGGCVPTGINTVWYEVTLSNPNNQLTIDLSTNTFGGNVYMMLATNDDICPVNDNMTLISEYCGAPGANITLNGLSDGVTYYMSVGSAAGEEGTFDICATESELTTGCGANYDCGALSEVINLTTEVESCVPGCNTGSPSIGILLGAGCDDFTNPTVWYEITIPATDVLLDITVTTSDFDEPHITLFDNTCGSYYGSTCAVGTGGSVTQAGMVVAPNTTYYIAVEDLAGGDGYFNICVTSYPDLSACNIDNSLVPNPLPSSFPGGTYPPATTVEFCYTINTYERVSCNYLQGIVPTFGECWEPFNPATDVTVPLVAANSMENGPPWLGVDAGTWDWYNAGSVQYNNLGGSGSLPDGADLPAGWFFVTVYDPASSANPNPNPNDPNQSFGDGDFPNCPTAGDWQVCFNLTTKSGAACTGALNCGVSIKTYADGEIGAWTSPGCPVDLPSQPTEPGNLCCLTLQPIADSTICNGSSIDLAGINETGLPGTFSWYDGDPTSGGNLLGSTTVTPVADYTYWVIYSESGCTAFETVNILVPGPLSVSASETDVVCNSDCDGTATATTTGGASPFVFAWNDPATQSTQTATLLCPGTFTVTVTDAGNCTATASTAPITEPAALSLALSGPVTNVSCNGGSNGEATVTASGGITPHIYSWPSGGSSATETGLSAGTTTVTVTDANFCTATLDVIITEPPLLTVSVSTFNDVSCNGGSNGSITPSASGGTTPYSYLWSEGSSSAVVTGLAAGNYTLTVTDVKTCTVTLNVSINEPPGVILTMTGSDANCFGDNNGSADADAAGGVTPYTWQWDDAMFQTTQTASNLIAGTYNVTVTDDNNCEFYDSYIVNEPAELILTPSQNDETCGNANGDASVSVTGGITPYIYAWGGGESTSAITNLAAATYTITVTDDNTCIVNTSIVINNIAGPTASITSSNDVSCNSLCDGDAAVTPVGGTPPYTYLWPSSGTDSLETGLCAGTHGVTVTDNINCQVIVSAVITQPATLNSTIITDFDLDCFADCDGSLAVSVNGGTTPYEYEWNAAAGSQTTATATGLCVGTYDITITDDNNCTSTSSGAVNEPTVLDATIPSDFNLNCFGNINGSLTVTVTGGVTPYSFSWDAATGNQTTATATGLTVGAYSITVTDQNSCTSRDTANVTEPLLLALGAPVVIDVSCFGDCNGSIQTAPSGGTTPYSYQWDDPSFQTTQTASNLCIGNYGVTITDDNNCQVNNSYPISQPPQVVITPSHVDAPCGGSTGSASVTVSGGVTPYTYEWNTGEIVDNITNIPAGSYTITVTDASLCKSSITIDVSNIGAPSAIITSSNNTSCNGICDGGAAVTPSGGTPPYTYLWSNSDTDSLATVLCAGTHTVTVTDNINCQATTSIIITQPATLNSTIISDFDLNCFGDCDGSLNVSVNGGTIPYGYSWDAPAGGQTTALATGLCAGSYDVIVTDFNGCVSTSNGSVFEPTILTATIADDTLNCNGDNNGILTVVGNGGTAPYSYSWDAAAGSQTNPSASNLIAGEYSVTITDNLSCTARDTANVTEPTLLIAMIPTTVDVECFGECSGSLQANPQDGTPPYTYQWDDGNYQTAQNAIDLCMGSYGVTITDDNGCSLIDSYSVSEPSQLSLTPGFVDASCNYADGEASISVTGGTAPYDYDWGSGLITDTITGILAGNYTVTVSDAYTCTAAETITVGNISGPTAIISANTDVSCNSICDGDATVTPAGGTSPYTYLWSNNDTLITADSLCAISYNVTVTDDIGCTTTASIIINEPATLNSAITSDYDLKCFGDCNGELIISYNGGTAPYTFLWDTAAGSQVTDTAYGLCVGAYFATVTDNNGCTATVNSIVTEPVLLTASIPSDIVLNCNGVCNGQLAVTANGGTAPYTYTWNAATGNQTTPIAVGLCASPGAPYFVTVTDIDSCIAIASAIVNQPAPLLANIFLFENVNCEGQCDGSATVNSFGGVTPHTWLWNDSGAQTAQLAENLCAGSYNVTTTDANNCTASSSVTIIEPSGLTSVISESVSVSCNGASDGSAVVTANGGTQPYSYLWSGNQTTDTASSLSGGTYMVTVTDDNGCSSTSSVVIAEPDSLNITISAFTDVTINGDCDGTATATITGGTSPYSVIWDDADFQTTEYVTGLCAQTYTVVVTDINGCTDQATITINEPEPLSVAIDYKQNIDCRGNCTGFAALTTTGGVSPYSYEWGDPAGQTADTASSLCAGSYTVTVTDANSATVTIQVGIIQPATLVQADITSSTDATGFGLCDGTAIVQASGGAGQFSYLWSNSETDDTAIALCADTAFVTVTDINGCFTMDTVVINEPLMTITLTYTDLLCFEQCDGQATVIATNGTEPYSFLWDDPLGQTTQTIADLCVGTYIVTVTDSTGFALSDTVTISQPELLTATNQTTDALCYGESNGAISVATFGGTGYHTILWSNDSLELEITNLQSGDYIMTVTDENSCTFIDTITVNQPDTSLYVIGYDINPVNCYGSNDGDLTAIILGGTTPYSYQWNDGNSQTTETAVSLSAGDWTVTVTDANNCTITTHTELPEPALIRTTIAITDVSCTGNYDGSFTIEATGGVEPYSLEWSEGVFVFDTTTLTITELYSDDYPVTVVDYNNCSLLDTISVGSKDEDCIVIPTGISPDGDSNNDTWQIDHIELFNDLHIEVFSRWGNKVWEYEGTGIGYLDYTSQWDGSSLKGKTLPAGPYMFIVTYDDIVKTGVITIFR